MSKSSINTLAALANAMFGDCSSSLGQDPGRSLHTANNVSTVAHAQDATPPWSCAWPAQNNHGIHSGQVARSLVEPAHRHADAVAIEQTWAEFVGADRRRASVPQRLPPSLANPVTSFDPWALPTVPAKPLQEPPPDGCQTDALFESAWDASIAPPTSSTASHPKNDQTRVRPVGSRIDDVAESVWESITSTPAQPWSWNAEVNTARSLPISAHEAQVRAERGRARLALLVRQLVVVPGDSGLGTALEGRDEAGDRRLQGGSRLASPGRVGANGGGGLGRNRTRQSGEHERNQPAAM